jgi:hypothetical protein
LAVGKHQSVAKLPRKLQLLVVASGIRSSMITPVTRTSFDCAEFEHEALHLPISSLP